MCAHLCPAVMEDFVQLGEQEPPEASSPREDSKLLEVTSAKPKPSCEETCEALFVGSKTAQGTLMEDGFETQCSEDSSKGNYALKR